MTPGQVFLLVLFLLYLSDCFLLVPRRGFAFLSVRGRGRWWVGRPSSALGNDRGGLVFAMPLPPLGRAFVTSLWPISLTPDGFSGMVTSCANPGTRPASPTGFVGWKAMKSVGWEGRTLLVNGRSFLKLATPEVARQQALLLLKLAKLPRAQRGAAIEEWCRHQLSAKRVRRRVRVFERATAGLRQSCNLLFLITFFAVPLSYWHFGLRLPFLVSLGMMLLLVVLIGIEFRCLHRGLFPEQKAERLQLWMLVGFMPQYAMRAVDELSKGFLGCAHPLAVAEVFLDDRQFQRFRDALLRDLAHPSAQVLQGDDLRDSMTAARQFSEEFEAPLLGQISRRRLDEEPVTLPDDGSLEPESVRYCPRCLMPYEALAENCIDCGGVATLPLADRTVPVSGEG